MTKARAIYNLAFVALTTMVSAQVAVADQSLFWWTLGGFFAVRYAVDYTMLVARSLPETLKPFKPGFARA